MIYKIKYRIICLVMMSLIFTHSLDFEFQKKKRNKKIYPSNIDPFIGT